MPSEGRQTALTFAGLRLRPEHIARGTRAAVTSRGVSAQAIVTQQSVYQALINVCKQSAEDRRWEWLKAYHTDHLRFIFIGFCPPLSSLAPYLYATLEQIYPCYSHSTFLHWWMLLKIF